MSNLSCTIQSPVSREVHAAWDVLNEHLLNKHDYISKTNSLSIPYVVLERMVSKLKKNNIFFKKQIYDLRLNDLSHCEPCIKYLNDIKKTHK